MLDFKGSRWYKCDLHLHTPASRCFANQDVTAEQWVDRAIEQGLHCVAVTDHNTPLRIKDIQDAATDKQITVFPGVELTCDSGKIHLLILFDPSKGEEEVRSFLSKCDIEHTDYGKQDAATTKGVFEVFDIATNKCGAIVIPAHIDEFSGLEKLSHQNLEKFYDECVRAVQVVHKAFYKNEVPSDFPDYLTEYYSSPIPISPSQTDAWKKPVNLAIQKKLAVLTFSDNPNGQNESKHGLWGIGSRFTWIKMDEPSLEGLRQAFLLPDHRILNDFDIEEQQLTNPDVWFKSLRVKRTSLTPREDLVVDFNPQLNAVIGGRGSGKSSVLRFIRGVFNRNVNLIDFEDLLKEQDLFYKKTDTQGRRDALGIFSYEDSEVEIQIVRKETLYKINASKINSAADQTIIISKWSDGDWQPLQEEDENFLQIFEFEMYSQKQIYEIAKNPNALRERIDNAIEPMGNLLARREKIANDFLETRTIYRSKKSSISNKIKLRTELADISNTLKTIDESGITDTIKSKKKFDKDKENLFRFASHISNLKEALDAAKSDFHLGVNSSENIQAEYKEELIGVIEKSSKLIADQEAELDKIISTVSKIGEDFQRATSESEWGKALERLKAEIESKKESLSESEKEALTQYEDLNLIAADLREQLKKIDNVEDELLALQEKASSVLIDYIAICKEITELRSAFISESIKDPNISIEVKGFRNKNQFESQLRAILNNDTSFYEDFDKMKEFCFNGPIEQRLAEYKMALLNAYNQDAGSPHFGGHFKNALKRLTPAQIDSIEILMPEDEIIVKYKPEGSATFKSLSAASAGQKTAAILSFLLSFGDMPLLLDQPEDDLDNRLVYELVVNGLKKAKENRQIIVVTHNANIPVNGDAEYIISMDSSSTDVKVLYAGTVENSEIKKEICDVMEGSEKAFKLRSERYKTIFS